LSWRLRFTSRRRSMPSCSVVNRGWVSPSAAGSRRDGWIACVVGSVVVQLGSVSPGPDEGLRPGTGTCCASVRSSHVKKSPFPSSSPSPPPFPSSGSAPLGLYICTWTGAVGVAGEPVNSIASSSAGSDQIPLATQKRNERAEGSAEGGKGICREQCRLRFAYGYAPSSKKYTRVLSPRM
jgi:hypothetical protein